MNKICEDINYAAYSILLVASFGFMALAVEKHAAIFLGPATVALFLAFSHFVAMLASRERQRTSEAPDNVRGLDGKE